MERAGELDVVGAIESDLEIGGEGGSESGGSSEPVGDLSVENVGRGELGLGNVSPVELEDPVGEMPVATGDQPARVQWKLACANPELGSKLVEDLLAREPGVLRAPPPKVEKQGHSLRIAYHVHPGLLVADRTQIAARLMEVLRSLPVGETLGGQSGG